ncbi:MAG: phenylalanine--tRNA ligase subunit beta [Spirochaetales bacterium]|nr:phenylalanine--tRNA ligase subunit beta [Spirochaetales bacterium]
MLVSINWIKQYVDLPENITKQELGEKFTLATCEVEKVEAINQYFDLVKIVKVTGVEPHPSADKLRLATVDLGNGESATIVCGAPNVRPGILVPYAPVWAVLPGDFAIEPRKIRGVESCGMLCGETELAIGDDDYGLKEFPEDAPVGMPLSKYLGIETDIIFDIDNKSITHRPDLWGHYGMAREFATVFKKELKDPFSAEWKSAIESKIVKGKSQVERVIEDGTACLAYCSAVVKNVKVGQSPDWLKNRLSSAGLRSINNIVDISNFVMLELGMPNHIFDLSEIKGNKIVIRQAGEDKEFVTLDEAVRNLEPTDSMVCDAERPLAIAGIMGGLNSGVSDSTTELFIETANWVDAMIRKTSTRIGLRTDSSLRFEKHLDSQQCKLAMYRIIDLICQICPDAVVEGDIEFGGVDSKPYSPVMITTSAKTITDTLGIFVDEAEIVDILQRLAFLVEKKGDKLSITVPSFRATKDVSCEADIIEEIGRIIGFDNITPVAPESSLTTVRLSPAKQKERRIKDFLVYSYKALEIMTYPMVGEALLKKAQWPELNEELVLVNSISRDADRMRPSLIPGVLKACAENVKNYSDFRFFEFGRSYHAGGEFAVEKPVLLVGAFSKKATPFMELQDKIEELCSVLRLRPRFEQKSLEQIVPSSWVGIHPFENVGVSAMGKPFAQIFTVHPSLMSEFKMKGFLSLAVVDLSNVMDVELSSNVKYLPLPKFPSSTFDCTVVVPSGEPVARLVEVVSKVKIKEIASVKIADIFEPEDSSKKYVTVRTVFQDRAATLTREFLENSYNQVVKSLEKAGFGLKVD